MGRHNKYVYCLYIKTRSSKDISWEDAELEPYDFFIAKKEAQIVKSAITRTELSYPVIQIEPL